jgi:hypothetical protein
MRISNLWTIIVIAVPLWGLSHSPDVNGPVILGVLIGVILLISFAWAPVLSSDRTRSGPASFSISRVQSYAYPGNLSEGCRVYFAYSSTPRRIAVVLVHPDNPSAIRVYQEEPGYPGAIPVYKPFDDPEAIPIYITN